LNGGTNHIGEVFDGNGEKVHEGLVVCDGAFIPAALGVNPFATITALAERLVELPHVDGLRWVCNDESSKLHQSRDAIQHDPAAGHSHTLRQVARTLFLTHRAQTQATRCCVMSLGKNGMRE
jgi:hypothetical protein